MAAAQTYQTLPLKTSVTIKLSSKLYSRFIRCDMTTNRQRAEYCITIA
jgi:hypothetical protein